jgi:hypothetical protein
MIYSAETQARIAALRAKGAEGTLTREDMREAVRLLKQDRNSAATASSNSYRRAAKAEIPDADSLLGELGGLE